MIVFLVMHSRPHECNVLISVKGFLRRASEASVKFGGVQGIWTLYREKLKPRTGILLKKVGRYVIESDTRWDRKMSRIEENSGLYMVG